MISLEFPMQPFRLVSDSQSKADKLNDASAILVRCSNPKDHQQSETYRTESEKCMVIKLHIEQATMIFNGTMALKMPLDRSCKQKTAGGCFQKRHSVYLFGLM